MQVGSMLVLSRDVVWRPRRRKPAARPCRGWQRVGSGVDSSKSSSDRKSDGKKIKPNEISHVKLGSQADLAGIEKGWELVAFGDVPLATREHLFRELEVAKTLGEGNEKQKPKSPHTIPFKLTMYTAPPVVSARQSVERKRLQVVNNPQNTKGSLLICSLRTCMY